MTAHAATARHRQTGWSRWYAACPCGWSDLTTASKNSAEAAAVLHIVQAEVPHECYDVESMEYAPDGYRCLRCRIDAAAGVAA